MMRRVVSQIDREYRQGACKLLGKEKKREPGKSKEGSPGQSGSRRIGSKELAREIKETNKEGKVKRINEEQVQVSGSSKYVINIESRNKPVSLTTSCT